MTRPQGLAMFVVYDRPRDFPNHVVARQHVALLGGGGQMAVAYVGCLYETVADAMREYESRGYAWLPRDPDDDPPIVGCWI